ncbi:hypothetical protein OG394_26385 [Kribbella sp. NBC_01245]|uniref:hypothetical protein n=1 Tax=Kribbella sp. NBC_01245 TaxID=2903578 RepID=UPI002E2C8FE5|nr:hypothetical protein [Kribbella sp. NBC_01245]
MKRILSIAGAAVLAGGALTAVAGPASATANVPLCVQYYAVGAPHPGGTVRCDPGYVYQALVVCKDSWGAKKTYHGSWEQFPEWSNAYCTGAYPYRVSIGYEVN